MSIPGDLGQQVITAADARCDHCQTSSRLTGTPGDGAYSAEVARRQ